MVQSYTKLINDELGSDSTPREQYEYLTELKRQLLLDRETMREVCQSLKNNDEKWSTFLAEKLAIRCERNYEFRQP